MRYIKKSIIFLCWFITSCVEKENTSYKNILENNDTVNWVLDKNNVVDTSYTRKAVLVYKDLIKKNKPNEVFKILTLSATYLTEIEKFDFIYTDFIEKEFLKNINDISRKDKLIIINYLVSCYNVKMNFKKVKEYGNFISNLKAIDNQEKKYHAEIFSKIVNFHIHSSQLDSSYHYINKSKNIYKEINDKAGVLNSQINEIRLDLFNKNFKESLIKINRIIDEAERLKDENVILRAYLQKIEIYGTIENPNYYSLNEKVYKRFLNNDKIVPTKRFIFRLYYIESLLFKKEFDKAKILLKSIEQEIFNSNLNTVIEYYDYLVKIYEIETKTVGLDNDFCNKLLEKYKKDNDFFGCQNIYQLLIADAKKNGDYEKALELSEESFKIYNLYVSQENRNKIIEFDAKYNTEKLNNKIKIDKIQLEKKNQAILLLITLVFILCLGIMIYYLISKQNKIKRDEENKTFFTKQLFQKIEIERKRIANDLHDSISYNLLELKSKQFQGNEEANSKIIGIIENLRKISRNLHPVMFERLRLKASIEDLVNKLQNDYEFFISAEIKYDNGLDVYIELQIYRIIQEAISNIIKHSKAKAVKVLLKEEKDVVILEIMDNGIGYDFKEKFNSKKSFGIHSLVQRANSIGAKIDIESSELGTVVKLYIKK